MNKFFKISLYSLLSLGILIIIAVIGLTQFTNPNDYKSEIEKYVNKRYGLQLAIRGNIAWHLYPNLGIGLSQVHLSDPKSTHPKIASIELAEINLKLLPLLSKQLVVNKIHLVKPTVYLRKAANGELNIKPLLTDSDKTPEKTSNTLEINVKSFSLESATIHWIDPTQTLSFNQVDLQVNDFQLNKEFPAVLSFNIKSNKPELIGTIKADSHLYLDLEKNQYKLNNFKLSFNLEKTPYSSDATRFQLLIEQLNLDAKQSLLNIPQAVLTHDSFTLNGELSSTINELRPIYSGKLTLPKTNLRKFILAMNPALKSGLAPNSYREAQAAFEFSGPREHIKIEQINAVLDKSKLTGSASIKNLPSPSEINVNLSFNELNLDDYLVNNDKNSQPAEKAIDNNATSSQKDLVVNALLSIDRLKAAKLIAGKVHASVIYKNGIMTANPVGALLYDGVLDGSFKMDFRKPATTWQLKQNIQNVNIQDLLSDYLDNDKLSGKASVQLNLNSALSKENTYADNLNGQIIFALKNGFYTGIDLSSIWLEAKNIVERSSLNIPRTDGTVITQMTGSLNINEGIGVNNDFVLYNPTLFAKGQGQLDFGNDKADITLTTFESSKLTSNGQISYQPKNNKGLPINIGCKLSNPCPSLDKEALAKMVIQNSGARLLDKIFKRNKTSDENTESERDSSPAEQIFRGIFGN